MDTLNFLNLLEVYLILCFVMTVYRRYGYYRAMLGIIVSLPLRWPRLLELTRQHRTIFLTWPTILPVAVTFGLMVLHSLALNLIWIEATVTPRLLLDHWVGLILLLGFGVPMLYLDMTALFSNPTLDREALEKHFDQAEYWLRSWLAPAVKFLTFGKVDPRQMVQTEVRKALAQATLDFNRMMWRWALQIAMRFGFGLTLWLTWAFSSPS
ncbi:MAG: hypothetical protein NZM31_01755 [Gemmatales bacterium]|nr:hypothetical protein [Gemmatales bacterium]MDW8385722.1 hypothetical protein [Gemmatales bacterium]